MFEYFYIVYVTGGGLHGNTILKQHLPDPGKPNDGLNIANAHKYIMGILQTQAMILTWQSTTEKRYNEWKAFMTQMHQHSCPDCAAEAKTPLELIPGSKEDTDTAEKSKAALKILGIQTEKVKGPEGI